MQIAFQVVCAIALASVAGVALAQPPGGASSPQAILESPTPDALPPPPPQVILPAVSQLRMEGAYSDDTLDIRRPRLGVDGQTLGQFAGQFYPVASRRAGEEGMASAEMCVDVSGRPNKVGLFASSGYQRLDDATVMMAKYLPLKPATLNGKPAPFCGYVFTMVWSLRERAPPTGPPDGGLSPSRQTP